MVIRSTSIWRDLGMVNKNVEVKRNSKEIKIIFDFIQIELYHCRL